MKKTISATAAKQMLDAALPKDIGTCEYRFEELKRTGENKPDYENIFSHFIHGSKTTAPLCINTDVEKNASNIQLSEKLFNNEKELPIYLIIAHGLFDIDVITRNKINSAGQSETHYYNDDINTYRLGPEQFIIHPAPLGTAMDGNQLTISNTFKIFDRFEDLKKLIMSNSFYTTIKSSPSSYTYRNDTFDRPMKKTSDVTRVAPHKFNASLFSPPLYSTLNKTYYFNDKTDPATWMFGVVQVNKNYDGMKLDGHEVGKETWMSMLGDINMPNISADRLLNNLYPGVYNNATNDKKFSDYLKAHKYIISEKELLNIYGDGIYIPLSCSPLFVNVINYETKKRFEMWEIKDIPQNLLNVIRAVNHDVNVIVQALNKRWEEMVQYNKLTKQNNVSFEFTSVYHDTFYETFETIEPTSKLMDKLQDEDRTRITSVNLTDISEGKKLDSKGFYEKYVQPITTLFNFFKKGGNKHKRVRTKRTKRRRLRNTLKKH
jgi:hypothetical protein